MRKIIISVGVLKCSASQMVALQSSPYSTIERKRLVSQLLGACSWLFVLP